MAKLTSGIGVLGDPTFGPASVSYAEQQLGRGFNQNPAVQHELRRRAAQRGSLGPFDIVAAGYSARNQAYNEQLLGRTGRNYINPQQVQREAMANYRYVAPGVTISNPFTNPNLSDKEKQAYSTLQSSVLNQPSGPTSPAEQQQEVWDIQRSHPTMSPEAESQISILDRPSVNPVDQASYDAYLKERIAAGKILSDPSVSLQQKLSINQQLAERYPRWHLTAAKPLTAEQAAEQMQELRLVQTRENLQAAIPDYESKQLFGFDPKNGKPLYAGESPDQFMSRKREERITGHQAFIESMQSRRESLKNKVELLQLFKPEKIDKDVASPRELHLHQMEMLKWKGDLESARRDYQQLLETEVQTTEDTATVTQSSTPTSRPPRSFNGSISQVRVQVESLFQVGQLQEGDRLIVNGQLVQLGPGGVPQLVSQ